MREPGTTRIVNVDRRFTLGADLPDDLGVRPGDKLVVERLSGGGLVLTPAPRAR